MTTTLNMRFLNVTVCNIAHRIIFYKCFFVFYKNIFIFSKDSRMTIMFMVLGATLIYEVIVYILNYIVFSTNIEMMNFIKILAIEIIYNLIIVIILYPLIQKCGYAIENEYKGNKILTRYF